MPETELTHRYIISENAKDFFQDKAQRQDHNSAGTPLSPKSLLKVYSIQGKGFGLLQNTA